MINLDEACVDCSVLYEFCKLVDALVADVIHLEAELVSTRYELSKHLKEPYNDFLRSDIFSSLGARHSGNEAYDAYVELFCDNQDPMEANEKEEHMWKLAHGLAKYNI
jgi:hypothetical protein